MRTLDFIGVRVLSNSRADKQTIKRDRKQIGGPVGGPPVAFANRLAAVSGSFEMQNFDATVALFGQRGGPVPLISSCLSRSTFQSGRRQACVTPTSGDRHRPSRGSQAGILQH